MNFLNNYLRENFDIDSRVIDIISKSEAEVKDRFSELEELRAVNQYRVLKAMQECRLSDTHFNWNSGYGYNDSGRETLEEVFSKVFKAEDSIVRPTIVNGTHALTLCLTGLLRPGNEIVSVTSKPYDTLDEVIGISNNYKSSLKEYGVSYKQVEFLDNGDVDFDGISKSISVNTTMVYIQRSTGYGWRDAITVDTIEKIVNTVKGINKNVIVMLDNCYGEFLDTKEPTEVGVDVMAGSLIKNPGGGLALTGGYIVGKADLIELISYRMTSPGIGKECGLTFGQTRNMFQGLFIAPHVVVEALKGAILCAKVFENLGYEVSPKSTSLRSDIIQAIKFRNPDKVIAFCEGVQKAAPVDSYVTPVPWDMPGYDSQVIMAAGAFVQGSSIELSADAPIKEPYIAYFQGGLTYEHSKFGVMVGLQRLLDKGLF